MKNISHRLATLLFITGSLTLCAAPGARTPFTTIEAENNANKTNAQIVRMTVPKEGIPAAEASGHGFVELVKTGDFIEFTNPTEANSLVLRHCIPDAPNGGGITATLALYVNDQKIQDLTLSSKHNWLYAATAKPQQNGQSNTPTPYPHVFWDEAAFLLPVVIKPGDRVRLQKDDTSTAAFYRLDLVDFEMVKPPQTQPENSLDVTKFGAQGKKAETDTAAFKNCLNAARAQHKTVWVPAGTFLLNEGLKLDGVKVQGAGMWYSKIIFTVSPQRWTGVFNVDGKGSAVSDLAIDGSETSRSHPIHAITGSGSGWLVKNVWITHTNTGFWAGGEDGLVSGCRVRFTYADGININNGKRGFARRITVEDCHVRGSGDDSIAILNHIQKEKGFPQQFTEQITIRHNTAVAPWWASCCDLAGGKGHLITENYFEGSTLCINLPSAYPMLPQEESTLSDNVIYHGGWDYAVQRRGAIWIFAGSTTIRNVIFANNRIVDPLFHGIDINGGNEQQLIFRNNRIESSGGEPVQIGRNAKGLAGFESNTITGNGNRPDTWLRNHSAATFRIEQKDNSWQTAKP